MSVHYKFKAALEYSTITFDGIHISVADLKKAIIDQKRLVKSADSDLQITNAQTKEVYEKEESLIPKNTSVIVARVPVAGDKKKSSNNGPAQFGPGGSGGPFQRHQRNLPPPSAQPTAAKGVDLATLEGTEEEKIQAMMSQSTADYDPSNYVRMRGQTQHGRVPPHYRCYKCNHGGHWIRDCPLANSGGEVPEGLRKSTGIPRSFMVVVDGPQVPGALITPEGRYAVPAVDHAAYTEKNKPQAEPPVVKPKIPEELLCNLCNDLLTDALLVPCCANSYCDECIRTILLESEEQECPGCKEKEISPNSLIPNRFLRTAVNAFKNETGYSKPQKVIEVPSRAPPPTVDLTTSGSGDRGRKVSLDELPDDLFPHSPRRVSESEKTEKDTESDDKTDLYDFNDGSIPSPFASSQAAPAERKENEQAILTIGSKSNLPVKPYAQQQQRPLMSRDREYVRHGKTPLHSGMPPLPGQQHPHYKSPMEPPPPGFEEAGPSRDDRSSRSGPPMEGDNRSHQAHHIQSQPPGLIPFNPSQPPPGYRMQQHPSQGMGGPPPGMFPGGHPGSMQHPQNYGMPPQFRGPLQGAPPEMYPSRHPSDRYSRDRPLRSRYPPRDRERMPRDDEPHISGAIEDPLKEFERIMREKDRRKELAAAVAAGAVVKRDRSPSFSPGRSPPSPFVKRDRSRSFSRSPSPKRQRVLLRRRKSYSRSNSRSPLPSHPPRRMGRSRSRSRNRSSSPLPQLLPPLSKRRSPRRAPPFSPSPPPSRFPPRKHDKLDYHESRVRYDPPPPSRYGHSTAPKSYERSDRPPREYEKKYEGHPKYVSSKYDPPPLKYDLTKKYEPKYESSKYESSKYESSKYEALPPGKYEHARPPATRSSYYHQNPHSAERIHGSREGDREREVRHFEYEQNVAHPPPGTEPAQALAVPPSLFESIIPAPEPLYMKPPGEDSSYYKGKVPHPQAALLRERDLESLSMTPDSERGGNKELKEHHRRRKSAERKSDEGTKVEKKVKKEKKKHKKKSRDEKDKKSKKKKSKTDKAGDNPSKEESDDDDGVSDSGTGSRRNSGEAEHETSDAVAGVICDSTVKSPERHKENDNQDPLAMPQLKTEIKSEATFETGHSGEPLQFRQSIDETAGEDLNQELGSNLNIKVEEETVAPVSIPPSKWDKDDDEDGPPGEEMHSTDPVSHEKQDSKTDDSLVTSDILKRAESALFQKSIGGIAGVRTGESDTKKVSPKRKAGRTEDSSADKTKEVEVKREKKTISSIQVTVESAAILPSEPKRPVRDRLGSKIEDSTSRPLRSRERSKDRSNPTVRSEVSTSRDRDRRDVKRDTGLKSSRSPIPVLSSIRTNIRSRSRDAPRPARAYSRSREDRYRDDRARDERNRNDRIREEARLRDDRHRADMRGRRRSNSRPRMRSRSRDRRTERNKSPLRPLLLTEPIPARRRSRSREKDDRSHRSSELKPEVKVGEPTKTAEVWKQSEKFKPMAAADVFDRAYTPPPGETEKKSTPVPLAVRKQKRINIKLASSVSKPEAESSSSSSEGEEAGKVARGSIETDEEKKEEKRKKRKEKKKAVRRKSNSSTESSSEEEDKKKKRNKKKKKKKSKKKKK